MNRSATIRAMTAATFGVLVVCVYIVGQYAIAQKASLDTLPEYPFVDAVVSLDDIVPPERDRAEAELRRFAGAVAPGYRPAGERFLAAKGEFIWDAVRSSVGGCLSRAGFHVRDVGQTPHGSDDLAFIVWDRPNTVQHWIDPEQMLAVGLQNPLRGGRAGEQHVHLYAYFQLSRA